MTELLVAIALVATTALVTGLIMRRRIARLAEAAHDVVRNPSRRLPTASSTGEQHELAEWINALAEEVERSRKALNHERTLLGAVADLLTHGVIAIDGEHKIELLNDAARKMLGVQSSLVGEPLLEFVRVPELHALVASAEDASAEVQLPNGPRTLVRAARTFGRDGRVLLLEDVTNVRRLESVRRDFVANVSHELRTPVAVIRANAETLLAGAQSDPQMGPKLIDGLHRNAERLARILADLLDLSRLDAGQYRLDIAPVGVRAVTDQSLSAVETQAKARNVTLDIAIPPTLHVHADAKALDQILVNLIDNAVKYTRPDGHVWVEARDLGDAIRVEVRDDGPGISDKHRERVFERFYRADASRSREAGGTGLGLSIVKHLVESMNGTVGVEANAPRGSVFWLRLPKATTTVAA
ncbi:MAG TPA: ATP-binding protein [Kofleriaceae bacterium]|jgi:two-component system phosphate regulon sensor histidine kinase PhoR|nr:ATP-binding protein [Kofleriaceae bacterium]